MDCVSPSGPQSQRIKLSFSEKLTLSLSYIVGYCSQVNDLGEAQDLKNTIECYPQDSAQLWLISAINRRLIDLTMRETLRFAPIYLKVLNKSLLNPITNSTYIPIDTLGRVEKSLFRFYATEISGDVTHFLDHPPPGEVEKTRTLIDEASKLLNNLLPEYHDEYRNYVNSFLLYKSESLGAGTSFALAGSVFLRTYRDINERNLFVTFDRLIHETAHLHLHYQSMDDPFVNNGFGELYPSPFRDEERPMIGVFHAHFVLYRLIKAFSNEALRMHFPNALIDETYAKYLGAWKRTTHVLENYGQFTPLGKNIFQQTRFETRDTPLKKPA